jgi:hypothetical protein
MELIAGNWDAKEPVQICAGPLWRELLKDLADAVSKARIAARFHGGLADGFVQAAVLARAATGLGQVVLSGGCMHNRRLARLLRAKLEAEDFEVIHHFRVSPGDGGLSYGQAAVAAAKMSARSESWTYAGAFTLIRCRSRTYEGSISALIALPAGDSGGKLAGKRIWRVFIHGGGFCAG